MRPTVIALLLSLAILVIACGGTSNTPSSAPGCHPSYEGACLDPSASDYDCTGGSGDGPLFTGRVRVVGLGIVVLLALAVASSGDRTTEPFWTPEEAIDVVKHDFLESFDHAECCPERVYR